MSRRWVKLWVSESLRGTIRFDFTPAERGVWYDLLILAGDCRQEGLIGAGSGTPYPLKWIAGTLNISPLLLRKTINICKSSARIEINGDGIRVLNWQKYQSEYERQKPFRYKKVTPKVTNSVTQRLPVEVEEDIEEEDIYIYLFGLWNELKIITHKKMTADMKRAIDTTLKDYSQEEIELAMRNYAEIVKGTEYYFKHRWTLIEFLSRRHANNVERFLDLEIAKSNFKVDSEKEAAGGKYKGYNKRDGTKLPDRNSYTEPPYDSRLDPKSPDFIGADS